MTFPKQVKLVEVGPRDGLQNESVFIPSSIKIEMIRRLAETGLQVIEATSFVSPKFIPQLADQMEVFQALPKNSAIHYPVLVPNLIGLNKAMQAGATEISVFTTPSQQFSQHNTRCSVEESMTRIQQVMEKAKQHQLKVRAYLSCVLGCPYEGEIAVEKVVAMAKQLHEMGCYEISLGDTIGVGTPLKTKTLLQAVLTVMPVESMAVHFHDTYGQALTNIYVALEMGISVIDSSVAGLGGCPYAKGASGNVATEDVLYMLNGMGIATGVDLDRVIEVGRFISSHLGKPPQSKVNLAKKP